MIASLFALLGTSGLFLYAAMYQQTVWAGRGWKLPPFWLAKFGILLANWPASGAIVAGGLLAILWPILTFLALLIFQQSIRRAKIKPVHLFRCAVYSCDLVIWLAPIWFAWPLAKCVIGDFSGFDDAIGFALGATAIGLPLVYLYRLAAAHWLYLRFDHAIAMALASQLIVILAALAAMSLIWPFDRVVEQFWNFLL